MARLCGFLGFGFVNFLVVPFFKNFDCFRGVDFGNFNQAFADLDRAQLPFKGEGIGGQCPCVDWHKF